jgi:hypothetical protein
MYLESYLSIRTPPERWPAAAALSSLPLISLAMPVEDAQQVGEEEYDEEDEYEEVEEIGAGERCRRTQHEQFQL